METTLAERIKTLRAHYKLSVKEFAHACELSHVAIFQLEKGRTLRPHRGTLIKIAKLFGAQQDWILYGNGEMLPNGSVSIQEAERAKERSWQEEAYYEIKQKNTLLEREIERLWQLVEKQNNAEDAEYENIRMLRR